ncbi:hypothetical protein [Imhoffiella purpurea]|uniref:hypothetical protein n=1 Tax=Imhoffiella purpurea TaxID=1249627 RepID=UPI0005C1BC95|nr:hypothetical protein [Imhoffiella purpurea]
MNASEPHQELCREELDSLLRIFERSDEPEVVKEAFERLCLFFAWAGQHYIDTVFPRNVNIEDALFRDWDGAVRLEEYSAWFARIVALRMTGQSGDAEEPRKTLQVIRPDQAFGWANPPHRPSETEWISLERDVQMSACVALLEIKDPGRGKRTRAKKKVANWFGCSLRRVQQALNRCPPDLGLWANSSAETLDEIRKSINPFPFRISADK